MNGYEHESPIMCTNAGKCGRKYLGIRGAVIHSDRGASTPASFTGMQSINMACSEGGKCHDNARCESMWGRMKSELLYDQYDTEKMTTDELKTVIWRCFISYWNNRRICAANGGLSPMVKRQQYYDSLKESA